MSEGMITALCFLGVLFFILLILLVRSARKTGAVLRKMFTETEEDAPNPFLEDWEASKKADQTSEAPKK